MKTILGFLILCLVSGLIFPRVKSAWRVLSLLALCAFVVVVFFVFNKL